MALVRFLSGKLRIKDRAEVIKNIRAISEKE
jgi:hypothetical protein